MIDSTKAAISYSALGWHQLLTGQFVEAETSLRRGIELDTDSACTALYIRLPSAFLLQGNVKEASRLYLDWKDKPLGRGSSTWRNFFLSDFTSIKDAGIVPPKLKGELNKIEELLLKR